MGSATHEKLPSCFEYAPLMFSKNTAGRMSWVLLLSITQKSYKKVLAA